MGKTWKEVEKIASDRNKWRGLVSALMYHRVRRGYEEEATKTTLLKMTFILIHNKKFKKCFSYI